MSAPSALPCLDTKAPKRLSNIHVACCSYAELSGACRCQPAPSPHQGPTKEERAIEAAKQRNRQQQLQRFSDPAHGPFHLLTADRPTNTQLLKQQVSHYPAIWCTILAMRYPPDLALQLAASAECANSICSWCDFHLPKQENRHN